MKKVIKIVAVICVLSLLTLPVSVFADTMQVANCNVSVTLRTYPSVYAEELMQVPLGATVESIGWENGFNQVRYSGLIGWILTDYLTYPGGYSGSASSSYYSGDYMRVSNCNSWVSLRSYPSVNADAITTVPLGTWVISIGWDNGFNQVVYEMPYHGSYRTYTGWILTNYLSY